MIYTLFLLALLASPLAAQDSIRSYRVMRLAETDSTVSYHTRTVTPPPVHDTVRVTDSIYCSATACPPGVWSAAKPAPPPSPQPPPPPPSGNGCLPTTLRTVNVSTTATLLSALGAAVAGDCILMAAGTYGLAANIIVTRNGTALRPIAVVGPAGATRTAIVDGNQRAVFFESDYVYARRVRFTDLGVYGVQVRDGYFNVLDSVEIDNTAQQALKYKNNSSDNVVKNSKIHHTGVTNPQWGEGMYVGGTADPPFVTNGPVLRNQILNNIFGPNVTAEHIDVKAANYTLIRGNTFDGTGSTWVAGDGARGRALISVQSASYVTIDDNDFQYGRPDGVAFFAGLGASWVTGNVVTNNVIDLQDIHNATVPFWGFNKTSGTTGAGQVTIRCSNTVINGTFGNTACTP